MKCSILCFLLAVSQYGALLPYPNDVKEAKGSFQVTSQTGLVVESQGLAFEASCLQQVLQTSFQLTPAIAERGTIRLRLNPQIRGAEAYRLVVSSKQVVIEGATAAGVFYGVQTLEQWLWGHEPQVAQGRIPAVTIVDAPAYPYRALMLDPARHFLPVEQVQFYIDQMARYKYNTLQLHLTDDQGWRMEIKSHPALTQKASDGQFYTQQQLKDLVQYAAQRHVQLIPEMDVPGHTAALLVAYPSLRCEPFLDSTFVLGQTVNVMLSAADEQVYQVLDDVIGEMAQIFPSKTLHLGGDESVIERNWGESPENRALMQQLGYTQPRELMQYFFSHVLESVRRHGMKAILWCELDNIRMPASEYLFPYPDDVTLVTWRNGLTPKCIELTAAAGHPLILAPGEYCYLDYPQYKNDLPEFLNWGMPITTLEKTYQLDPTYGLEPAQRNQIIGVMGTLWGEAIKDIHRANYMTWPRGLALAEAAWTQPERRGWDSFKERMYPNLLQLMKRGVSFRVPYEVQGSRYQK